MVREHTRGLVSSVMDSVRERSFGGDVFGFIPVLLTSMVEKLSCHILV